MKGPTRIAKHGIEFREYSNPALPVYDPLWSKPWPTITRLYTKRTKEFQYPQICQNGN